ncbi:ABC transporter ATP-binding protein [Actinomadura madurae]|uniref:ABC transporter ATP-binding protein n=1 Tax=Actinomadura madurae TaxID=1993 RepID=UPI0020D20FA1|nr:ABC transporter ATP-binding protein [Actinomadura madurae]MCQ0010881.1 ABC transporter ATP-binding protein [Actinomadura madurae]
MPGITIQKLTKVYPGGVLALDALDLDVADGEFFALLGPSGCGKTTLLRTIAGLETATRGTIGIGDRDVTRLQPGRRGVGMVFQDYALFPHMTVRDNVAYPLRIAKTGRAERYRSAADAIGQLGLEELTHRRPGELSGGQQQRVALAGPWWRTRRSSCWTSRCRTWTPGSGWRPARSSSGSSTGSPSPRSSSRTTRRRLWRSPTGSRSWRRA